MSDFRDALRTELERVKRESFVDGYEATDAEAMGLVLSHFYEWDGIEILKTAEYALEDANFHTASGEVTDIRKRQEADFG